MQNVSDQDSVEDTVTWPEQLRRRSNRTARELFEQATKHDGLSEFYLASMLYYGQAGLKKNKIKARELYEQAATKGYATAHLCLGMANFLCCCMTSCAVFKFFVSLQKLSVCA